MTYRVAIMAGLTAFLAFASCGDPNPELCQQDADCASCQYCLEGVCVTAEEGCQSCGNGIVEPGEICDGNCPVDCNDGNACTADRLTGSAEHCTATCSHTPITLCAPGDGCCPSNCSSQNDSDCSTSCGNGTLDPGETCDGDCPTDCDDGLACTQDSMTGSAGNCNAACNNLLITECNPGDGCCPAGCSHAEDGDCDPAACSTDEDCPSRQCGSWGACGDFGDNCDESGSKSRECIVYSCQEGACVGDLEYDYQDCHRETDGTVCAEGGCGGWSACQEFNDICDPTGTQTRDCSVPTCVDSVCTVLTQTESQECMRDTEGQPCAPDHCEEWGICGGFASTCDESGTQSRSCTAYTCRFGSCASEETVERQDCFRDTDGQVCGSDSCSSWGTCQDFSDTCDESGIQSRECTSYVCQTGACQGHVTTENRVCTRDTDGQTCASDDCGNWGSCGNFTSTCDETGTQSRQCTIYTCQSSYCSGVTETQEQSCQRDTDGQSCGTDSCGNWGYCQGFSHTCDETGTRSRTCTSYTCEYSVCTTDAYTDTEACTRDTDGYWCDYSDCGDWGECGDFEDTCDKTGTKWRECVPYECQSGYCQSGTPYPDEGYCERTTDGEICGENMYCLNTNCLDTGVPMDEYEPNNQTQGAVQVVMDIDPCGGGHESRQGTIHYPLDIDWYKWRTIPDSDCLGDFRFAVSPSNYSMRIEVYCRYGNGTMSYSNYDGDTCSGNFCYANNDFHAWNIQCYGDEITIYVGVKMDSYDNTQAEYQLDCWHPW